MTLLQPPRPGETLGHLNISRPPVTSATVPSCTTQVGRLGVQTHRHLRNLVRQVLAWRRTAFDRLREVEPVVEVVGLGCTFRRCTGRSRGAPTRQRAHPKLSYALGLVRVHRDAVEYGVDLFGSGACVPGSAQRLGAAGFPGTVTNIPSTPHSAVLYNRKRDGTSPGAQPSSRTANAMASSIAWLAPWMRRGQRWMPIPPCELRFAAAEPGLPELASIRSRHRADDGFHAR